MRSRLFSLEKDLAGHEIPNHNHGGCEDLHEAVIKGGEVGSSPDEQVVDAQANGREHNEDHELAGAAHALAVAEHVAHARGVVEDHGDDERYRCRDNGVDAEHLGEEHHHAEIDDECDDAHDAEFHDLFDELAHGALLQGKACV